MHMGMRHCLPGKLTVRLREADSSRLRHIAAGTHDLGDHPRFCCKCIETYSTWFQNALSESASTMSDLNPLHGVGPTDAICICRFRRFESLLVWSH
jgi:uncharacterized protein (DUF2237 family)